MIDLPKLALSLALSALPLCLACPTQEPPPADAGPVCEQPTEPPCRDQTLAQIDVNPTAVGTGAIDNTPDGDGFATTVDATAGGFGGDGAYVYGHFSDDGLVKVEVTDDDSFGSMDWDIGFRRYVVRLNSGDGGPSCVGAANLGAAKAYDDVTAVPDGAEMKTEDFMNDSCELIPDGSGLPTAPGVLLQNYWDYTPENCLGMTDNVYLIQLASGRHLKLVVTQYYDPPEAQDACQQGSFGDFSSPQSAHLHLRWAFLD
jgi:hypothetical protein